MAKREPLGVYLYGHRVANLTTTGRPGDISCAYTDEALTLWPGNTPLLSCSLPLAARRQRATNYFKGMLPEGRHLQALASAAKIPTYDIYGMLARYGRDVAGAAVIAVDDPGPRPGEAIPYTLDELAEEVAGLEDRPLAIYDDSELSIPGLQHKLLLVRTDDCWARPAGGRPSTHILKVEDRRYPGLVSMEAACMRLARHVGLTDVDVELMTFDGTDCLVVSRFDRFTDDDGNVGRIHQEDSCQALNRDPEANQGQGKYEHAGGPRLSQLAEILDRHAANPVDELVRLAAAVVFNTVVGNADAHGKNMSFLHVSPGVVELAPLYDVVPTALWPRLPTRAAMSVNGQTQLAKIAIDELIAEATRWSLDVELAHRVVTETVSQMMAGLDNLPDQLATLVEARASAFLKHA